MGTRSKVELLPEAVRTELERRIVSQSFGDYTALADWLAEQGFEIHRASVYRWGSKFEERCKAVGMIAQQARAMRDAAPDDDGAVTEMLTRLAQEKMFDVLMALEIDPEDIDATKLFRAIADMNRSAVVAKKYAAEVKVRAAAAAASVAAKLTEASKKGMSAEVAAAIRREILGIA